MYLQDMTGCSSLWNWQWAAAATLRRSEWQKEKTRNSKMLTERFTHQWAGRV